MEDINVITLVGRLTKDIELRKTQSGKSVSQFGIAVNRRGKDAGADFVNLIAWEKTAEIISQYAHKGDRIGIIGRLTTRNYVDKYTNKKVYVTEVLVEKFQFLEGKKQTAEPEPKQEEPMQEEPKGPYGKYGGSIYDDELPF